MENSQGDNQNTPPEAKPETKTQTKPDTTPPEKSDETNISVKKSTLESILEKQEKMEEDLKDTQEQLKARDEKIEMLEAVADVGRKSLWEDKHRGSILNIVRLGICDERPILAWTPMTKNEIKVLTNGSVIVNQTTTLILLGDLDGNGDRKEPIQKSIDYADFVSLATMEECEVVKKVKEETETGEVTMFRIRRKSGEELLISPTFLNAF